MPKSSANLHYRPDIDGLRAIAVLAVVFFHINFNLIPGGFVGVDIFFVISGFLITKIISAEILEKNFSFKDFYKRRIRRILPVFLVVTSATMIVGQILLLPNDLEKLLTSARYALLFQANVYFSKDQGYFDISADEKPLLHIWSLSVEEQYYFIWPILLLVIYSVANKLSKQKKFAAQLFTLCVTLALLISGFILTQQALENSQSSTKLYFLLQTRFSELLMGSFAAMIPSPSNKKISSCMYIIGLGIILFSLFSIGKKDLFPGYNALIPCIGAGLALYSGQIQNYKKEILGKRITSLPILVYLGLLSYSIYLWHWPILAFMRYFYGSYTLPLVWNLTALSATLFLSYVSYTFLEKKIKHAHLSFRKALFGIYIMPSTILLIACSLQISRINKYQPEENLSSYGKDVCHGNFSMKCIRGDIDKQPSVLMFGDSHAAALNSFIDVVGQKEGWSATVLTGSSCSPVLEFDESVLPSFARKPCAELKEFVSKNYQKYDAIFIASYWEFQLGWIDLPADKNYLEKFKKTIEVMAKSKPVYVFADVPKLPISPFRLARFAQLNLNLDREISQQYALANDVIKKIVLSIPNTYWIDVNFALSNFTNYGTHHNLPTYFDDQHLNKFGSTELGKLFSKREHILNIVREQN